jgi:hypothetical protein
MKNYILTILVLVFTSTVLISCKKGGVKNCSDLVGKVNAAEITYSLNPTTSKCQAYKTALNNLLTCSWITAQEKAAYQLLFNQLTC